MKNYEAAALCKEGFIERIRRGFYQFPNNNQVTEEQFIQQLLPKGIVCVESALFHYGYSDFAPREWSTVARTASRVIQMSASCHEKKVLSLAFPCRPK